MSAQRKKSDVDADDLQQRPERADEEAAGSEEAEEEELEPLLPKERFGYALGCLAVRRYACQDPTTARRGLDDNIVALLKEELGVEQSSSTANIRIVLCLISCALALAAHFTPMPFPQSAPLIVVCLIAFYAIGAALVYVIRVVEGDAFFLSKRGAMSQAKGVLAEGPTVAAGKKKGRAASPPAKGGRSSNSSQSPPLSTLCLRVRSVVDRFEPFYKLELELVEPRRLRSARRVRSVEGRFFLGDFFTQKGLLYPDAVRKEVNRLLTSLKVA